MTIGNPLVVIRPIPDFTGKDPDYKVTGEEHDLSKGKEWTFTLHFGAFHANSVTITDVKTGKKLRLGTNEDYRFGAMQATPTSKALGSVNSCITINKDKFRNGKPKLKIDYQYVGGEYGQNVEGIMEAITDIALKPVEVWWSNVLKKPIAYPPEFHTHHASTITGLSPTNLAIALIPLSLQEMTEVMERERTKIPENLVTYSGVQKITVDKSGIILDPTARSITLQLPRSSTEHGRLGLRLSYDGIPINVALIEDGNTGVVTGSALVDTELKQEIELNVIFNCDLKSDVQFITFYGKFKVKPLILEQVLAFIDEPNEFNEPYRWVSVSGSDQNEVTFKISSLWDRAPVFDTSGTWQERLAAFSNYIVPNGLKELFISIPLKMFNVEDNSYGYIPQVSSEIKVISNGVCADLKLRINITENDLVNVDGYKHDLENGCKFTLEGLGIDDRWNGWFKIKGVGNSALLAGDLLYVTDISILTPITTDRSNYQGRVEFSPTSVNSKLKPFTSVNWIKPINANDTNHFDGKTYLQVIAEARDGLALKTDLNNYLPLHGTADHALKADRADYATRAGSASKADSATKADSAAHATNAEKAKWAQSSETCSVADKANLAVHANNADRATTAETAINSHSLNGMSAQAIIWKAQEGLSKVRFYSVGNGRVILNNSDRGNGSHLLKIPGSENWRGGYIVVVLNYRVDRKGGNSTHWSFSFLNITNANDTGVGAAYCHAQYMDRDSGSCTTWPSGQVVVPSTRRGNANYIRLNVTGVDGAAPRVTISLAGYFEGIG